MTLPDGPRKLGTMSDGGFERWLVDSAKSDGPPRAATHAAWSKFEQAASLLARDADPGAGYAGPRAVTRRRAAWFVTGALSGSALTFALLGRQEAPETPTLAAMSAVVSVDPSPAPTRAASAVVPEPVASAHAAPPLSEPPPTRRATKSLGRVVTPAEISSTVIVKNSSNPTSTLAAEIAALDLVRRSLADQSFDHARRLLEGFRRDFPQAQLGRDAAALAIEALVLQGQSAEARRQAMEFLRRYPNDPHAARLSPLLDP